MNTTWIYYQGACKVLVRERQIVKSWLRVLSFMLLDRVAHKKGKGRTNTYLFRDIRKDSKEKEIELQIGLERWV